MRTIAFPQSRPTQPPSPEPAMSLTTDQLKQIVRQSVLDTLEGLGFESDSPAALQADMHYLRRLRLGSEDLGRRARGTMITMLITSALWLLWEAIRRRVLGG